VFFVTLGVYGYIYNYKVHSEMKRHSGRGIGGGIALLLSFIANVAMPFVTPAEVGSLYARKGLREPVRGWTGLWLIGPSVVGYLVLIGSLLSLSLMHRGTRGHPNSGHLTAVPAALVSGGFVLYVLLSVAGGIVWFIKTNGALNAYWKSMASVDA